MTDQRPAPTLATRTGTLPPTDSGTSRADGHGRVRDGVPAGADRRQDAARSDPGPEPSVETGDEPGDGFAAAGAGGQQRGRGETRNEIGGLARGGGQNLAGAVIQQVCYFGVTLALVHQMDRSNVGRYAQAFAFLSLLGLLALSGLRAGLTRFVAVHLADHNGGAVRGTVRLGLTLNMLGAALLGAGLFALAPTIAEGPLHDPLLTMPLRFVAVTLPFSSFIDAALSATQGWRTMRYYAGIGLVLEPVLRVGGTAALLWAGLGLFGSMLALLVSNVVGALAAGVALTRLLRPQKGKAQYRMRELFGFSTVSWFASLASTGLMWADVIILGVFVSAKEVGLYSVANRLVMLASFVALPISASFAPRIADLYHRQRTDALARTYSVATAWIVRLSLPAFAALLVFPEQLLRIFGPGYVAGATVTVIIALGKLVDASTGPCGVMLNQSGRPILSMLDNVCVLILNIGLNLYLIPRTGIVGSAVAFSASMVAVNAARVIQVRWTMGMLPFDGGVVKALVAGAASVGAGLVVRDLVPMPGGLLAGLAAIVVVYLGSVVLLGLSSEDRMVLGMLRRRVSGQVSRGSVGDGAKVAG